MNGASIGLLQSLEDSALSALFTNSGLSQSSSAKGVIVPLIQFRESSWSLGEVAVTLLSRHREIGPDFEDYLRLSIFEIGQNVIDHAQSRVGGLMCCRFDEPGNRIAICVADFGMGIEASLKRAGQDTQDFQSVLDAVFEGGVTSRSKPTNRGLGISNLVNAVKECRGDMVLLSSGTAATARFTATHFVKGFALVPRPHSRDLKPQPFPGTVVAFTLPLQEV